MLGLYARYFALRTCRLFFLTLALLTLIIWVIQASQFFDMIASNGIKIKDFIKIALYVMPSLIYVLLPISAFLAVFLELSRLRTSRELFALQGAGLSHFQIAKPFVISALVIALFAYFISFYLLPQSYREFRQLRKTLQDHYASFMILEGEFLSKVDGITIYVEKRGQRNEFHGIMAHDTRQLNSEVTVFAETCRIHSADNKLQLVVYNGTQQTYNRKTNALITMHFDKYTFEMKFLNFGDRGLINAIPPYGKFINQLFDNAQASLEENNKHLVHGHSRILWPFYCISLIIASVAFSIRVPYSRKTAKASNIAIICLNFSVIFIAAILENVCIKNISLLTLMYINALVPCIFGLEALREKSLLYSALARERRRII